MFGETKNDVWPSSNGGCLELQKAESSLRRSYNHRDVIVYNHHLIDEGQGGGLKKEQ
jgi:hypothetical protein